MGELLGNRGTMGVQKQAELWRTRAQFIFEIHAAYRVCHKMFPRSEQSLSL
jgi:hypothetical protein